MSALFSCYIGMVIVSFTADPIAAFFQGKQTVANTWISAQTSPATIKIVIFLIVIAIVAAKAEVTTGRNSSVMAPIEVIFYSTLTAILIESTLFSYLGPDMQNKIIEGSKLAHFLRDWHNIWLILPLIVFLFVSSRRRSSS